jgi:hypothetical protein
MLRIHSGFKTAVLRLQHLLYNDEVHLCTYLHDSSLTKPCEVLYLLVRLVSMNKSKTQCQLLVVSHERICSVPAYSQWQASDYCSFGYRDIGTTARLGTVTVEPNKCINKKSWMRLSLQYAICCSTVGYRHPSANSNPER